MIYTLGDGYATGHIWPEWPQILQALLPTETVVNISAIGAGPEWITTKFTELIDQLDNDIVIIQWNSMPRFDKLVQDQQWLSIVARDPTYHFNLHEENWWLSSGSQQEIIKHYHDNYIQTNQRNTRLKVYQTLVEQTLINKRCQWTFTSTEEQEKYSQQERFLPTRYNEIQPGPLVHFYFLKEILAPKVNLVFDPTLLDYLQTLIEQHPWQAYDPDRDSIWQNIVESCKKLY
jgi:hypothetical protein